MSDTPPTNPEIITQRRARALGLVRYFTGKPCKNGHVAERFVSDQCCVECSQIRKRRRKTERMAKCGSGKRVSDKMFLARRPCRMGHYLRYVMSGECIACNRARKIRDRAARRVCDAPAETAGIL